MYMVNPMGDHRDVVKWILHYLKGTFDSCICYVGQNLELVGAVDADFASDRDKEDLRLVCIVLTSDVMSWISRLQSMMALSIEEAEYMSTIHAFECLVKKLLAKFGVKQWEVVQQESVLHLLRMFCFMLKLNTSPCSIIL